MRNWLLWSAGILGIVIYRNVSRRHEWYPHTIISAKGDSAIVTVDVRAFKISSPAFEPGQTIPAVYSCEADDKSPPLNIEGTPEGTRSLALIMEDLDSPMPPVFDHWLVWNIPADTTFIPEGRLPAGSVQGRNTLKNTNYNGPCTPNGTHYYHFKLYALDTILDLPAGCNKQQLKAAMKGHILARTEMLGKYSANRTTQGNFTIAMLKAATKA